MVIHPAVIIHELADARTALVAAVAVGAPVTLLSAPGAGLFAGCLWWREVVTAACAEYPQARTIDILDCADAAGMAMAALRSQVCRLVLWSDVPAWQAVAAIARGQGGFVLSQAPTALDMAQRNAARGLPDWLRRSGDSA